MNKNEPYFYESFPKRDTHKEDIMASINKIKLHAKNPNLNFSVLIKDGYVHVSTTNNPKLLR